MAKQTKREPNEKVLNETLAKKKAEYETAGWEFDYDGNFWEAKKDLEIIEGIGKITDLFEILDEYDEKNDVLKLEETPEQLLIAKFKLREAQNRFDDSGLPISDKEFVDVSLLEDAGKFCDELVPETETLPIPLPKTIIESCRIQLTDDERLSRFYQHSNILREIEAETKRFAKEKETHKATIVGLAAQNAKALSAADTGFEWRDLECSQEFDFQRGIVTVRRPDTGEIVKTRSMTKEEMQTKMFENKVWAE
jgi:hypothetical protein